MGIGGSHKPADLPEPAPTADIAAPTITALVVTYNESRRLRECLQSLSFCQQLIVIDLGSSDNSVEIAKECGAEIIISEWVPLAEQVKPLALPLVKHDWILLFDPDEVFPAALLAPLRAALIESDDTGAISLPFLYHFLGAPLTTTVWGGITHALRVIRRGGAEMLPYVHNNVSLLPGYEAVTLPGTLEQSVRHYWCDSISQLIEKHVRYIRLEGEARFQRGQRFIWRSAAGETWRALKLSLITKRGYRGGFRGLLLSGFYAWYVGMSHLSLRKYQHSQEGSRKQRCP